MNVCNLIKMIKGVMKYHFFGIRTPLTISYLSTYQCNQKCQYCDWTKMNLHCLQTSQAIKLIQDFKKNGVVKLGFAGGESLCREDIDVLLQCSHECGLITSVSSNGREISKHINAIVKYVDVVQISLDGPENIHDELRGVGSYKYAIQSIQLLRNHHVDVIVNMVLTKKNIQYINYVIKIAERYKCKVLFQPVFYYDISESAANIQTLKPSYHEMYNAIEYLIQKKRTSKSISNSIIFLKYVQDTWERKKAVKCYANTLFCAIDPLGHIHPCCFDNISCHDANAATLGFKLAFMNCKNNTFTKECKGCYCNAYMEANFIFSLKLSACINALYLM